MAAKSRAWEQDTCTRLQTSARGTEGGRACRARGEASEEEEQEQGARSKEQGGGGQGGGERERRGARTVEGECTPDGRAPAACTVTLGAAALAPRENKLCGGARAGAERLSRVPARGVEHVRSCAERASCFEHNTAWRVKRASSTRLSRSSAPRLWGRACSSGCSFARSRARLGHARAQHTRNLRNSGENTRTASRAGTRDMQTLATIQRR
eukprot:936316-Rhodomonas_salina.1